MARQGSNGHGISPRPRNIHRRRRVGPRRSYPRLWGVEKSELFELVPQPVVVMDRDHTILHLNHAAAQAAGKSIEACVGAKFWDLFDNPDCRAGTCAAAQAVNSRQDLHGRSAPRRAGEKDRRAGHGSPFLMIGARWSGPWN